METWERKAHRLIREAAFAAWYDANVLSSGRTRKRHASYRIPDWARELVAVLGWEDRRAAEETAKAIFMRRADLVMMRASDVA